MVIIRDLNSGQFGIDQIVYPKQFRASAKDGRFLSITSVMPAPVSPIINIDWENVQLIDRTERPVTVKSIDAMVEKLNKDFCIGSVRELGPEQSLLEDPYFAYTLMGLMLTNPDFMEAVMWDLIESNTFMNAIVDNTIFTETLATNDVFTTELAKNTYFLGLVANNLDFIKALTNNETFRSDIKLIVKETGGSGGVTE